MPLVNIRLTQRDIPTSREQKARLIAGVSDLVCEVLGKRLEDVVVIIDEVDPDNWGEGGMSVTALRAARAKAAASGS